jgi:hypothetical protein
MPDRIAFAIGLALALPGCAAPAGARWRSDTVRVFGTLREALRDGETHARVDVATIASPRLVAVGAAAGLDGEITIKDGVCHVSRVRSGAVETRRSADVAATLMCAAEVERWQHVPVAADIAPAALDRFVARAAGTVGIDTRAPFPFVVEGELVALSMHVLAGECPIRAARLGIAPTSPPFERRFERVAGQLVGFHAEDGGGVITHHGSATHVHAIVPGDGGFTGHCDAVGVAAGAVLWLPAR